MIDYKMQSNRIELTIPCLQRSNFLGPIYTFFISAVVTSKQPPLIFYDLLFGGIEGGRCTQV